MQELFVVELKNKGYWVGFFTRRKWKFVVATGRISSNNKQTLRTISSSAAEC